MPAGTVPCGCPASQTMSHKRAPWSIGTYSSQPRSPTYEMRDASTGSDSISIVRQVANGKPSCDTSSPVVLARMSRARGPHRPSVHHCEVVEDLGVADQVVAEPLQVGHPVRAP